MASVAQMKWGGFLVLGLVLVLAGALAMVLPEISTFATGTVFGVALSIAGVVKVVQSLRVKEWSGFIWQGLTGAVEVLGGIFIYFNPLKGAVAITLVIALVFLVQGILQIVLALRVRDQSGWYWFAVSGLVSLVVSVALAAKLPYTTQYPPGTVAGVALVVAGLAYVAIGLTVRRGQRR